MISGVCGTLTDLKGEQFGNLLVTELSHWTAHWRVSSGSFERKAFWYCLCKCGNRRVVCGASLIHGRSVSCGCKRRANSMLFRRDIWNRYKFNAKKRKIEFLLTVGDCSYLCQNSCHYCGQPPSNVHRRSPSGPEHVYNGIDRVDNSLGYCLDNVVSCCSACNYAKSDMPVSDFIAMCIRVAAIHGRLEGSNESPGFVLFTQGMAESTPVTRLEYNA